MDSRSCSSGIEGKLGLQQVGSIIQCQESLKVTCVWTGVQPSVMRTLGFQFHHHLENRHNKMLSIMISEISKHLLDSFWYWSLGELWSNDLIPSWSIKLVCKHVRHIQHISVYDFFLVVWISPYIKKRSARHEKLLPNCINLFSPYIAYGTRRFSSKFTRTLHWSLSWAESIQSLVLHLFLYYLF